MSAGATEERPRHGGGDEAGASATARLNRVVVNAGRCPAPPAACPAPATRPASAVAPSPRAAARTSAPPGPGAIRVIAAVVLVAVLAAGCSSLRDRTERAASSATPQRTTGPPPGASQAPGPPLATASAGEAGAGAPPDPADPAAVATYCFARWQSFDARSDADLSAGAERAQADGCFTTDFFAQLTSAGTGAGSGGAGDTGSPAGDSQAWQEQRAHGARSTVTVLAATPLADTAATGRVVYLLNARSVFTTDNSTPLETVSTPKVTLLNDADGRWRIAGADLSGNAGDAPGR
ncbi:hypothetical protein [Pseudofrankia sp. BMG5.36]|uniref:hypothetical protein n=1 Tax=Pseudofrankia sp. BMG5.36 TaxID=1834512 RepID=UPI000AFC980E|nr:hypothetical protein [Pseudofrankia sp. BMG5.36]